jgi:ABC-type branched-subunit amino acid transport system ATPase component
LGCLSRLTVADRIDFRLERGARQALIGPNGAGKTTFVELVTGGLPPSARHILINGADVTELPQAARVKRGLARTFQINLRRQSNPPAPNRYMRHGPELVPLVR